MPGIILGARLTTTTKSNKTKKRREYDKVNVFTKPRVWRGFAAINKNTMCQLGVETILMPAINGALEAE